MILLTDFILIVLALPAFAFSLYLLLLTLLSGADKAKTSDRNRRQLFDVESSANVTQARS